MDLYKNVDYLKGLHYGKYLLYQEENRSFLNKLKKMFSLNISNETRSRPIMLNCEITNNCTNDCIICAHRNMKRKKMIMPMNLFEKVLHDYSEIGGGYISLTPRGEIFLDPFLVERLNLLDKYPKIKGISMSTNVVPIDHLSDQDLKQVLNSFFKIHISIYGLNGEEYRLMTQRDFYSKVILNIKRILEFIDKDKTLILLVNLVIMVAVLLL